MRIAVSLLVLGLLSAAPASAQTPSAQTPPAGVEAAYRAALATTPTPASLRADQADWLAERADAGSEDLAAVDADRIARLRRTTRRDLAARADRPSIGDLAQGCVALGLDGCRADRGGFLRAPSGAVLYWQVQQGSTPEDGVSGAAVLMVRDGQALRPAAWVSGAFYQPPELIETGDPTQLYVAIPGYWGGSGALNADVLFRWTPGAESELTEIDVRQWRATLEPRLPVGLHVWKGVDFHWSELAAWTPLWTDDDANCCASGGEADLDFAIEGDVLVLTGVNADDRVADLAMSLPTEVFDVVGRWAQCGHWGGEEPYDAERRAEIDQAVEELRCAALTADTAALKAKYADQPAIVAMLTRGEAG
jgi:hypothetical protein